LGLLFLWWLVVSVSSDELIDDLIFDGRAVVVGLCDISLYFVFHFFEFDWISFLFA
jgi:hypothetical protein